MKILELFSGTHSIGKAFPNDEIISVDLDPHFNPTECCDILEFDYKKYDEFDYIHASPPCTEYSQNQVSFYGRKRRVNGVLVDFNKTIHEECIKSSDVLVLKVLEIIDYFKPTYWTIENPRHHNWCSIQKRPFMYDIPYTEVDYCMYDYPIRKPTVFFNNFLLELKCCDKSHTHTKWLDFNPKKGTSRTYNRYVIPHNLCLEIAEQVKFLQ